MNNANQTLPPRPHELEVEARYTLIMTQPKIVANAIVIARTPQPRLAAAIRDPRKWPPETRQTVWHST